MNNVYEANAMTTESRPSERRRLRTRQEIIEATHAMLTEQGLEALSIRAVADEINYSPAALYRYFEGKDELIDAVRADCFERLNVTILAAVGSASNSAEALLAGGLAYLAYAREHPVDYHLMFQLGPSAATQAENHHQSMRALLTIIRQGVATGEFVVREGYTEEAIAYHCWATVHGMAMLGSTVMNDQAAYSHKMNEIILRQVVAGFRAV
jgi:AcrR family transcriptional regulator